jgi:lipoprotein-anchoring transpeptidase ErfK/SrfK
MKRRTFLAVGLTAVVFAGVRKASAASEFLPQTAAVETGEHFPIAQDDYLQVKPQYRSRIVDFPTREPPGTIIIDTKRRFLYLVLESGSAKRYGVGVGRRGFQWSGTATIGRKAKWPIWIPPAEMMERDREAAKWPDGMPGGPENPLGARALYLYQGNVDTLYRIHGTREPKTIGRAVSSGCVRMLNADAAELFERAPIGTKVIVIGPNRRVAQFKTEFTKAFRSTLGPQPAARWKQFKHDLRKFLPKWD